MSTTAQTFHTRDVTRLEVEDITSGLVNLLQNPSGDLGGWGWVTPVANTAMSGRNPQGWRTLSFSSTVVQVCYFYSESFKVTPGNYLQARVSVSGDAGGRVTFQFEYLDAGGAVLSSSPETGITGFTPAAGAGGLSAAEVIPASTVRARIVFRPNKLAGAAAKAMNATGALNITEIKVGTASTTAALKPVVSETATLPTARYRNIIGPTLESKIIRGDLNVGTLTATIADASLDPATDSLIRLGRKVRLMAKQSDGKWTPLFLGEMTTANVAYLPGEHDLPEFKRAKIDITAVDDLTTLANTQRPQGVAKIDGLPWLLEGCGVPWSVNGSGNQAMTTPDAVSRNENATALDQIALTRDSVLGEAWMDRYGVIQCWNKANLPATPMATIGSNIYSAADISWSSTDLINEVNIRLLRPNLATGETVEVPYGPYRDAASVDEWGTFASTFTIHGLTDNAVDMQIFANWVLAANKTPQRRVQSITIPIKNADNFNLAHASSVFRDVMDRIRVVNTQAGIDTDLLVRTIEHNITPTKWEMVLGFGTTGSVAMPTAAPELQSAPTVVVGAWQPLTLNTGWSTTNRAEYMISSNGTVRLRGTVTRASGTASVATLPVGYRPSGITHNSIFRSSIAAGFVTGAIGTDGAIAVGGAYTNGATITLESIGTFVTT